jgi:hypothetical protein
MEYPSDHIKMVETLKVKGQIKSKSVAVAMKAVDRADFTDLLPYTDWYSTPNLTSQPISGRLRRPHRRTAHARHDPRKAVLE